MADSFVETAQVKNEDSFNNTNHLHQDDEVENAKVGMGEVREENKRLKMKLEKIEKEYKSLQLRFFDILKKEAVLGSKKAEILESVSVNDDQNNHVIDDETKEYSDHHQLVSLCLGRSPREPKNNTTKIEDHLKGNLTLGLGSELHLSTDQLLSTTTTNTPENSIISEELIKEVEEGGIADHACPNSTTTKTPNNKTMRNNGEEEVSDQQTHVKRARVSVRARCDAPTMNDGCQWRKYGQKISKGNPCPRAYYRCTVAVGCPVRKQVQRCANDMSILITTYEGTHNHPLPISATAMASTTSAAASMLLSGSSISHSTSTANINSIPTINNNGINFGIYDHLRGKHSIHSTNSPPFHPTVTLDLTASPSSSASQFSLLSSNSFGSTSRFPSSNLSFSSPYHQYSPSPTVWGNRFLSYGSPELSYDKNKIESSIVGKQSQDYLYQRYMENNNQNQAVCSTQDSLTETLTKAITSDPSFKSVIVAALSSVVGGS